MVYRHHRCRGEGGDSEESEEPSTRDHCPYGHRADGTCRACPKRTYWAHDGGCNPVEHTPGCPDGHAIVSSWPGKCVPIICPATPVVPGMYEARDADTGYCTCPAGDEWLPDHNGCRPSSCPHGRDSDGRCLPPPTTTTTTVAGRWSGICKFSFTKGDAASVDLPTHGAGLSYTLRPYRPGTDYVPAGMSATRKAGGSYTVAGTPTAGGDWTAILIVALPRNTSDNLPCSFAVPAAPDTPEGLAADGDSRGVAGGGGQSVVEWDEVVGATSYEVRHKLATASAWAGPVSTTGLTTTLGGLTLDRLYFVQVRAVNRYGNSAWSDIVYTYPTRTPAGRGDTVGIMPVWGYRSDGSYDYVLCLNIPPLVSSRPPPSRPGKPPPTTTTVLIGSDRVREITDGVEEWETATGMVTVSYHSRNCSVTELSRHDRADNMVDLVRVVPDDDVHVYCGNPNAGACIIEYSGAISYSRVTISDAAVTTKAPGRNRLSCSVLFGHALHEAGHAFGLGHPDSKYDGRSVMTNTGQRYCKLPAVDIRAIIKIYQSR